MLVLSHEDSYRAWLPSQVYRDEAAAVSALTFLMDQFAIPGDPRQGPYVLAIVHRASGAVIGHVGFSPYENDVEIGFAVGREYQRRGLAVEAIMAACDWIFHEFGLDRIIGIAGVANLGSRRALVRAGFAHREDKVIRTQGTVRPVSFYALPAQGHRSADRLP